MKRLVMVPLLLLVLVANGCATAVMSGAATGDGEYSQAADDSRITREVRSALYRDPMLGDERITVSTSRGIVILRGSVDNRMHISRALELVESVKGVRGVNVELLLKGTP